ncbi:hypothetical protein [Streptomyces sp. NPDC002889]|uniref:hypothetical protein n=1 Tax=Streptomyces sp. NPDC002889 TaxID=3364669 RepID=UPI0036965C80
MTEWFVAYHLNGGDPPDQSYYRSYEDECRDCGQPDLKLTDTQREAIQEETERFDRRWQAGLKRARGH